MYGDASQEVSPCREHDAAMPRPAPTHSRECAKGDVKPANGLRRATDNKSVMVEESKKEFFKIDRPTRESL